MNYGSTLSLTPNSTPVCGGIGVHRGACPRDLTCAARSHRCAGRSVGAPLHRIMKANPRRWTPWIFRPPRASARVVIVTCGPSRPAAPRTTTQPPWSPTRPRPPLGGVPTAPNPVSIYHPGYAGGRGYECIQLFIGEAEED